MAVTIVPIPNEPRLCVVGDVQADLAIPAAPPRSFDGSELVDTYYIALSDGSLIRAGYHEDPRFHVVVEGAGTVSVDKAGRSITVDWTVEWVGVSSDHAATALAQQSPRTLPLFGGKLSVAA